MKRWYFINDTIKGYVSLCGVKLWQVAESTEKVLVKLLTFADETAMNIVNSIMLSDFVINGDKIERLLLRKPKVPQ